MSVSDQELNFFIISMSIISFLSMIGCCAIIAIYIYYKDIRAFTFKLVVYLAISGFLYSLSNIYLAYLIPVRIYPSLCTFQAMVISFSSSSALCWTTSIPLTLYLVLVSSKSNVPSYERYYLLVGWGIPLILTVLPFSTDSYSTNVIEDLRCWIRPGPGIEEFIWRTVVFYLPLWVMVPWYFYAFLKITKAIRVDMYLRNFEYEAKFIFIKRLYLYPIILIICNALSSCFTLIELAGLTDKNIYLNTVSCGLVNIGGLLNSIVYLCNPTVVAKLFNKKLYSSLEDYKFDEKSFMVRANESKLLSS